MTVRIRRLSILKWHVIVIGALFVAHVATLRYVDYDSALWSVVGFLFDVNDETNIPTFFSAMAIFATAFGAFWAGAAAAEGDPAQARKWKILGALLVFLAFDEGSQIHETIGDAAANYFGWVGGYGWVFMYGAITLVAAAFLFSFWLSLERAVQLLFAAGGVIYVGSAIGLEVAEAFFVRRYGEGVLDGWVGMLSAFEECGEMLGIAILLQGVLLFIERTAPVLNLLVGDHGDEAERARGEHR